MLRILRDLSDIQNMGGAAEYSSTAQGEPLSDRADGNIPLNVVMPVHKTDREKSAVLWGSIADTVTVVLNMPEDNKNSGLEGQLQETYSKLAEDSEHGNIRVIQSELSGKTAAAQAGRSCVKSLVGFDEPGLAIGLIDLDTVPLHPVDWKNTVDSTIRKAQEGNNEHIPLALNSWMLGFGQDRKVTALKLASQTPQIFQSKTPRYGMGQGMVHYYPNNETGHKLFDLTQDLKPELWTREDLAYIHGFLAAGGKALQLPFNGSAGCLVTEATSEVERGSVSRKVIAGIRGRQEENTLENYSGAVGRKPYVGNALLTPSSPEAQQYLSGGSNTHAYAWVYGEPQRTQEEYNLSIRELTTQSA